MTEGKELGEEMVMADPAWDLTSLFRTISEGFVDPRGRIRYSFPGWLCWDYTLRVLTAVIFRCLATVCFLCSKTALEKTYFVFYPLINALDLEALLVRRVSANIRSLSTALTSLLWMESNFQGHKPCADWQLLLLNANLIFVLFSFCLTQQTRLSTNTYLSFYPSLIPSVFLFTSWLNQIT